MSSTGSSSQVRPTRLLTQQEKLARVFEEEVYPLFGQKLADLLMANLVLARDGHVLQIGCGLGTTNTEILQRTDADSRLIAVEATPTFVERARANVAGEGPRPPHPRAPAPARRGRPPHRGGSHADLRRAGARKCGGRVPRPESLLPRPQSRRQAALRRKWLRLRCGQPFPWRPGRPRHAGFRARARHRAWRRAASGDPAGGDLARVPRRLLGRAGSLAQAGSGGGLGGLCEVLP